MEIVQSLRIRGQKQNSSISEILYTYNVELNKEIKKEIAEARAEIKKGKFHSLEKVKKDLKF